MYMKSNLDYRHYHAIFQRLLILADAPAKIIILWMSIYDGYSLFQTRIVIFASVFVNLLDLSWTFNELSQVLQPSYWHS